MKKLISYVMICVIALCSFAACGSKSKKKGIETENTASIVGKWAMNGFENSGVDGGGLIFGDNGKGGVFEDTSSIICFEGENVNIGGAVLAKDYISETDGVIKVEAEGRNFLDIKRVKSTGSGYDGTYTLQGGLLYDTIAKTIQEQSTSGMDAFDVTLNIAGETSQVVFNDVFTYDIKGDDISISGFSGLLSTDGSEATAKYTIDGDTLTLTDSKSTETLQRVA